jgi:hypothetical protein
VITNQWTRALALRVLCRAEGIGSVRKIEERIRQARKIVRPAQLPESLRGVLSPRFTRIKNN